MGFPVAYRKGPPLTGQVRAPGGSRPQSVPVPLKPANDNRPSLPKPANDNRPQGAAPTPPSTPRASPQSVARDALTPLRGRAIPRIARTALYGLRALPAAQAALSAYELGKLVLDLLPASQTQGAQVIPTFSHICAGNGSGSGWRNNSAFNDCRNYRIYGTPDPNYWSTGPIPQTVLKVRTGSTVLVGGQWWARTENAFQRAAGTYAPVSVAFAPGVAIPFVPSPLDNPPLIPLWVDPLVAPIGQPVPTPEAPPFHAIPARQPNPWRAPSEQPQRGPLPATRPLPLVQPDPASEPDERSPGRRPARKPGRAPRPSPRPLVAPPLRAPRPVAEPEISIEIGGSKGGVRVHPVLRDPPRKPPGRRTKEKKLALRASGLAVRILDALGEADDYIDSLYKALPEHRQREGHLMAERAQAIYRHFGEIDWQKAIENLAANEVEDRVFGEIGNQSKKASQTFGLSQGLQLGKVF